MNYHTRTQGGATHTRTQGGATHTRTQGGATHLIKLLKLRPPVAAVPRHVRQALARGGGGGPLHQELHKPVGEEQSWTMELDLGC